VLCVSLRTRGAAVGQWEAAYYKLEPGYYRLVLEAKAGSAAESMNVAVDDLDIGPCGLSKQPVRLTFGRQGQRSLLDTVTCVDIAARQRQ